jgi:hypothetical protein
MHAGEVITKLVEDAYFMRVDNRVTQVPPFELTKPTTKPQAVVQPTTDATVLEQSYRRTPTAPGHQLEDPLRAATALVALAAVALWWFTVTQAAETVAARAPHTGLEGEPVLEVIAEAEATQTATSHVSRAAATMPAAESKKFDARNPPRQARTTASPPSLLNFAICCSQRNSRLWG